MKSPAARLLGTVRLGTDGRAGQVINTASQDRHWMVAIEFEDGTVTWAKLCDTTPAVTDEPAPKAKGRSKTPRVDPR